MRDKIVRWAKPYLRHIATGLSPTSTAMEGVYQTLFMRDLARIGEVDDYYPVGSAANYSLLYAILRVALELKPPRVLDIGAGQTSILWSRLLKRGYVGAVVTLEHDPIWGAAIGPQLEHELLLSPLREEIIHGRQTRTYDWQAVREKGPFNVISCDGPLGTPRCSRLGVLRLVDESLPADFVVIMDDAERDGEKDTIKILKADLDRMGRRYRITYINALKRQAILAGGAYERAAHY